MKEILMKKTIISIVIALAVLITLAWISKTSITAYFLSKEFGVPVRIETMIYNKGKIIAKNLDISNPKGSKTPTALTVQNITVETTPSQIFGTPLTIDLIELKTIMLGVEIYGSGKPGNNWGKILSTNGKKKPKKKSKPYLIKRLRLKDLTVVLTDASGKTKSYGPIDFRFNNISEESGFPLHDIEKAIMQQIIKEIILKYNIPDIIKGLDPTGIAPQVLPSIKIFGGGSK